MLVKRRTHERHDALTGLINRAEFGARLHRVLCQVHREMGEHALLYIDLDQFKLVNDVSGHAVGDMFLKNVAQLIASTLRSTDTLSRLGGDEFGILLENCGVEQAQRIAQKICERIENFRFVHEGQRFRTGASIGLVPVDQRWPTTSAILQASDTACYAAKEAGGNRVYVWFASDLALQARNGEMQWTSRIEQALDDNQFVLYAQRIQALEQPISPCKGIHAEVLLRMLGPDGDVILPSAFLPAAERFHLASRIDKWVLKEVLAWMRRQVPQVLVEKLHVNLSGQSVGDKVFHRWAIDLLKDAGPEMCSRLCLEITETAAITNMQDASAFIAQVKSLGLGVALDDFGAGASSFIYLKTLSVDSLKIDGEFVKTVVHDSLNEVAVRCFVNVAKVVQLYTVAEFVESEEVFLHLRNLGVDYVQGYFVHRPEPLDNLHPKFH